MSRRSRGPAPREASIRFGTSGWRGVLGDEITYARLEAVVAATAEWFVRQGRGDRVLVGYDGRFASEDLALVAARCLQRNGLRPQLSEGVSPTPVVTFATVRRRAAGALVLTASHNPPEYHGIKVFGPQGGGIDDASARRIERRAEVHLRRGPVAGACRSLPRVDWLTAYREAILRTLDRSTLRRSGLRVIYDAMHGCGAGGIDTILRRSGVQVSTLRPEPDPRFGGSAPDPSAERLRGLASAIARTKGLVIGLANDGDADRLAVMDERGRLLSETQVVALLVDHLARTGRARKGVAISVATGALVERVAESHGLAVLRRPMGFKHLSAALISGQADVAGEESGGFAWRPFARDKDGILSGCLLAERVACDGRALGAQVSELERRFGRLLCGRTAIVATPALRAATERLATSPPGRVGSSTVRSASCEDGVRLVLDDGFVMVRASGTEPVIRVYAEGPGRAGLDRRLAQATRLLRAAAKGIE